MRKVCVGKNESGNICQVRFYADDVILHVWDLCSHSCLCDTLKVFVLCFNLLSLFIFLLWMLRCVARFVPTALLALWWETLIISRERERAAAGEGVWYWSWCWYLSPLPKPYSSGSSPLSKVPTIFIFVLSSSFHLFVTLWTDLTKDMDVFAGCLDVDHLKVLPWASFECLFVSGRVNANTKRRKGPLPGLFLLIICLFQQKAIDVALFSCFLSLWRWAICEQMKGEKGQNNTQDFSVLSHYSPSGLSFGKKAASYTFHSGRQTSSTLISHHPASLLCTPWRSLLVFSQRPNRPGQLKVSVFEEEMKKSCTWQRTAPLIL